MILIRLAGPNFIPAVRLDFTHHAINLDSWLKQAIRQRDDIFTHYIFLKALLHTILGEF